MPVKIPPIIAHETLGCTISGILEDDVVSYLGIPYATLNKRWTWAIRRDDLSPTFRAITHGPKCPQDNHQISSTHGVRLPAIPLEQDEFGCLNLNVFRPSAEESLLPVFVWVHGGAFLMGSASEPTADPRRLVAWSVEHGSPIIVVAINYRLGPFGFLYSSDLDDESSESPWRGNFGLHDQRVAFDWIQHHIRGFGGDPTRVTIGGQSSGGYAIHAQIAANTHLYAQPSLFARAVVHSGPLAPRHIWSIARLNRIWNLMLDGEHFTDSVTRVKRLRNVSAKELLRLAHEVAEVGTWGVFADGIFISPKFFDSNWDFKTVQPRAEAIMVGDCSDERSVFITRSRRRGVEPLYEALCTFMSPKEAIFKLSKYSITPESTTADASVVEALSHLAQDLRYLYPTDALTSSWPNAFRYHVSLPNPFPGSSEYGMAHHSVDTMYLFRNFNEFFKTIGLQTHLAVADSMGASWLGFIYGSEPWSGGAAGMAAHFGKEGMKLVKRDDVRMNEVQKERLEMWSQVGLVTVGKIANLWISEQDARGHDVEFVY